MNNLLEQLTLWIVIAIIFGVAQFSNIKPPAKVKPESSPAITQLGDHCYKTHIYAATDPFIEVDCEELKKP